MENATQALIIAGGILFAILTLSLFVFMFNNMAVMQNAKADKKITKEIADWNMQWEAYQKDYLYGLDVLTVVNKAEEVNKKYNNSPEYKVEIIVYGQDLTDGSETAKTFKALLMGINKTTIYRFIASSTNDYGRICMMEFEEVHE